MRHFTCILALSLTAACTSRDSADSRARPPQADTLRPIAESDRRASPGQIVLSRVMINPTAVSDDLGEWIEVTNLGDTPADLRGWSLRSANDGGFVIPGSVIVTPHGTVTLGRHADSASNGGIRVDVAYTGITLGNASDWLVLRNASDATVDSVAWSRAPSGAPLVHGREGALPLSAPVAPAVETEPTVSAPDSAAKSRPPRELVVRVLDVGQGDAILIQNGGSTVLVDGGPKPQALGDHLDALGLNGGTIDAVILTHAHADHYQGLRELFASRRHIAVRYFWENRDPSTNVTLGKLRDSIASRVRAGSLVYRDTDDPCANGTPVCTVTLKGGAKLHIMRPYPGSQDPNNHSAAVKLVGPDSASFTMWMAGDAEHEAIDWFSAGAGYQKKPGMRVDVLKADHHGSCNGVNDRYLNLLDPSMLVVSLGAVNDYGHMHAQAKAMYRRLGIPWYRTDQNGTITVRSAGTPGSKYSVSVERGSRNGSGPSDRRSTQPDCAAM